MCTEAQLPAHSSGRDTLRVQESAAILIPHDAVEEREQDGVGTLVVALFHYDVQHGTPRDGLVFVDVGVNKGFEMIRFAALYGDLGRRQAVAWNPLFCKWQPSCAFRKVEIYGFDLNQDNILTLERTAAAMTLGPGIHLYNYGVSDADSTTEVCLDPQLAGQGDEHASIKGGAGNEGASCHDVPIVSLDSFVATHNIGKIHVLKIDIEGFDGRALKGCRDLLSQGRVDAVIFECCHLWHRANLPLDAFASNFSSSVPAGHSPFVSLVYAAEIFGYDVYLLGERNMLWISSSLYTPNQLDTYGSCGWCNFALLKQGYRNFAPNVYRPANLAPCFLSLK